MNLRGLLARKYFESYEGEGTMVIAPIGTDELAAHEAHIGLEGKVLGGLASHSVSAHASDSRPSDETIEIGDVARFKARAR